MVVAMNNDRDYATTEVQLDWTSKKEHGSEGLTHRATATIAGDEWSFALESPKKSLWVGRGWRNGNLALYREARTLKDVKDQVQAHVGQLTRQSAERQSAEAEAQLGVTRLATDEAAEHLTHMADQLGRYAPTVVDRAAKFMRQFGWHMRRKCTCPTPLHRMSCGDGGRVRVVTPGGAQ